MEIMQFAPMPCRALSRPWMSKAHLYTVTRWPGLVGQIYFLYFAPADLYAVGEWLLDMGHVPSVAKVIFT